MVPPPTYIKYIQHLGSFASFYHKFIPHYAVFILLRRWFHLSEILKATQSGIYFSVHFLSSRSYLPFFFLSFYRLILLILSWKLCIYNRLQSLTVTFAFLFWQVLLFKRNYDVFNKTEKTLQHSLFSWNTEYLIEIQTGHKNLEHLQILHNLIQCCVTRSWFSPLLSNALHVYLEQWETWGFIM